MSRLLWIALALAVLHAGPAFAQPAPPLPPARKAPTIPFDGAEVFSYVLKTRKFAPIPTVADLAGHAADETVVIVFGQNRVLDDIHDAVGGWDAFLRAGGAVLVATDFADRGRLAPLGVAIAGGAVSQIGWGAYKGEMACPLLREYATANPVPFEGLKGHGLATNRPSYLLLRPNGALRPLATFPPDCVVFHQAAPELVERGLPDGLHYVAGTPFDAKTPGRVLVLAGHGIFTNGMLLQPHNDNFDFAVNCLRWLREGPDGKPRSHALFVVDGNTIPSFDVGLKPPLPPLPTIAIVNQLLSGMEREGFLHRVLDDNVDVHRVALATLLALTVVMLVYGSKKLAEVRHHTEAGTVAMAGPYAAAPSLVPLAVQRTRSQIERDGLWDEARALARQGLLEMSGIPLTQWDGDAVADRPRVAGTGGWLEQLRLRRQVDRVYGIAAGRVPGRFAWAELVALTQALQDLRRAVQEGRLRMRG